MPEYRRIFTKGGIYFFTINTYKRQNIFSSPKSRAILQDAIAHVKTYHPFKIEAYYILPNHIHFLWHLPEDDFDFATRIRLIKRRFSIQYREKFDITLPKTTSRKKRNESTIWQRRYWEHLIRDEDDLEHHIDYIHYNPVKHGWVKSVRDWEDSSFHEYVRLGFYDLAWGDEYEINEKKFEFGE